MNWLSTYIMSSDPRWTPLIVIYRLLIDHTLFKSCLLNRLLLLNIIECLCGTFCCVNNSNLMQLTSSTAFMASRIGCISLLSKAKSILYAIMYFPVFGSRCWSQYVSNIFMNDWWPLRLIGIKAGASVQPTSISETVILVGSAHSHDGRLQPNTSLA